MDDTAGTGTVFCCHSDENNFGNLRFHFGVKNSPFYVKSGHFWHSGLKTWIGPYRNQMTENPLFLFYFWPKMGNFLPKKTVPVPGVSSILTMENNLNPFSHGFKNGGKISKNDRDFVIFKIVWQLCRISVIDIKCPSFGQMSIFWGLVFCKQL